ncbi:hypothetical protein LIA77_08835 [Sarocladium implicatum]|nr:hypothetical protein LIA77_08835 [Sarocladium implicatum]
MGSCLLPCRTVPSRQRREAIRRTCLKSERDVWEQDATYESRWLTLMLVLTANLHRKSEIIKQLITHTLSCLSLTPDTIDVILNARCRQVGLQVYGSSLIVPGPKAPVGPAQPSGHAACCRDRSIDLACLPVLRRRP